MPETGDKFESFVLVAFCFCFSSGIVIWLTCPAITTSPCAGMTRTGQPVKYTSCPRARCTVTLDTFNRKAKSEHIQGCLRKQASKSALLEDIAKFLLPAAQQEELVEDADLGSTRFGYKKLISLVRVRTGQGSGHKRMAFTTQWKNSVNYVSDFRGEDESFDPLVKLVLLVAQLGGGGDGTAFNIPEHAELYGLAIGILSADSNLTGRQRHSLVTDMNNFALFVELDRCMIPTLDCGNEEEEEEERGTDVCVERSLPSTSIVVVLSDGGFESRSRSPSLADLPDPLGLDSLVAFEFGQHIGAIRVMTTSGALSRFRFDFAFLVVVLYRCHLGRL